MRKIQLFTFVLFLFYVLVSFYAFIRILKSRFSRPLVRKIPLTGPNLLRRQATGSVFDSAQVDVIESDLERKYWDQWALTGHYKNVSRSMHLLPKHFKHLQYAVTRTIDIWSNNGLGDYLWQHIIQGRLRPRADHLYLYGEKFINRTKFRYKTSAKLDVSYLPDTSENIILILNGRDNKTVSTTLQWLNDLPNIPSIQNVGLVLIGDELCNNSWLLPYLNSHNRTELRFVFLVYDSLLVDNHRIFQFPLGVATYRGFPQRLYPDIAVPGRRKYLANFLGTIYPNSSRSNLVSVLRNLTNVYSIYLRPRYEWTAEEEKNSLISYVDALRSSDLTLCPIGLNSESYRIYEAISHGSVPVIEDRSTSPQCDPNPHRLAS